MEYFTTNLKNFENRFPALAAKVASVDVNRIEIGRAADGGVFYAVRDENGKWQPVTNHMNPGADAQKGIDRMQHRLGGGLAPAVVVGLSPGYVLDSVYRYFKSRTAHHEPFRHIYVVIDSLECLVAWLKCTDRTEIISNLDVLFFSSDEVCRIVELCEQDEQRSHLFIPVTELDEAKAENLITALAELYIRREKEYKKWIDEINDYYDSIDDKTLIEIISGNSGRKPRILMPTHSSTTVVQYSTRDTCSAFERLGWETKILRMDRDLSKWRITKEIREFRPDVFLFINHLRTEDEGFELYPRNLMFATWIQDTMPAIHQHASAEKWNRIVTAPDRRTGQARKRDILIGYTDGALAVGFPQDRAYEIGMIVNTSIFRKQELSEEDRKNYGCEICFASHRGKLVESIIREDLAPILAPYGIGEVCLLEIAAYLTAEYKKGLSFISYEELKTAILHNVSSFADAFYALSEGEQSLAIQRIFWALNDVVYRNTVLEWCDELGADLHIYGRDWDRHPRFSKYAKGELKHGSELSKAYQCAKFGLHLNSLEGTHQRPLEIIASGGVPIWRFRNKEYLITPVFASALRKTVLKLYGDNEVSYICNEKERDELIHFLFFSLIFGGQKDFQTEKRLLKVAKLKLQTRLSSSPDWLIPDVRMQTFADKEEFAKLLKAPGVKIPYGYLISKVNDISIAENIREVFLSFLGSEMENEVTMVFESKINDVINHNLKETLSFIRAVAQSNIKAIAEKAIQPHITPALKLFAAERIIQTEQPETAGEIAKTISPDSLSGADMLRRFFALLVKTGRKEQAREASRKLSDVESIVWMAEVCAKENLIEDAGDFLSLITPGMLETDKQRANAFRVALKCNRRSFENELINGLSDRPSLVLDFVNALLENGRIKKAEEFINVRLPKHIEDPFDSGRLARFLLYCGKVKDSISLFLENERVFKEKISSDHYFWKAHAHISSYNFQSADEAVREDIKENGSHSYTPFLLSYISWLKGDLEAAEKELTLFSGNNELSPQQKVQLNVALARLKRTRGNAEEAVSLYTSANDRRFKAEKIFSQFEMALTLESLGKVDEAFKASENGAAIDNFSWNPNRILWLVLKSRNSKNPGLFSELAWETAKMLEVYTFSWSPIKPWLKIVEAAALDAAGEREKGEEAILKFLEEETFLDKNRSAEAVSMIKSGEYWRYEKCAMKIAAAMFSNLPEGCFDRRWIENECLKKD